MNGTRTWSIAIATAVSIHVAVFIPDGPPRTAATAPTPVSVTLAPRPLPVPEPTPEPTPDPPPEPTPEPEATPEPRPVTPPPERRHTQRSRLDPEPHEQPSEPSTNPEPSAAPRRIDLGSSGNSGVVVRADAGSTTGVPGGRGDAADGPVSAGGGSHRGTEDGAGDASGWRPVSELHVRTLPWPKRVPELTCDAAARGVEGTVVLGVQVRNDGAIHRVRVIEGIGGGCDEIAARALRRATFDPAVGTHGRPVDFEVRYEYAFERAQ